VYSFMGQLSNKQSILPNQGPSDAQDNRLNPLWKNLRETPPLHFY